jgi:hypothetical protein
MACLQCVEDLLETLILGTIEEYPDKTEHIVLNMVLIGALNAAS